MTTHLPNGTRPGTIQAFDLWKSYESGRIPVLRGVSFAAESGDVIALCGVSGSGKSTILHLLASLQKPDRGRIVIHDRVLRSRRDLLRRRRHEIGFIFQLHNLLPDLTVEENCLVPSMAAGRKRAAAMDRLDDLTQRLGLSHRRRHRIQDLSGGERQRTAICRALMNRPAIVLADEPTGSLDESHRDEVFRLLVESVRADGGTLLVATHDRALAEQCDRILIVTEGRLHECPSP